MAKRTFGKNCKVLWSDTKRIMGLPISFTHYSIVENPGKWIKCFVETGMIATQIEEFQLFRVDDFSIFESFTDKILGIGNIDIYVHDANQAKVQFTHIKDPYKVYDLLSECVERDKASKHITLTELQR